VPHTFDKRYFAVLPLAPCSHKRDARLTVHLAYPQNVGQEFLKQFTDLVIRGAGGGHTLTDLAWVA